MIIGKTRTNQPVEDEGKVAGLVEDMVESGDLDNAKPLYWHNIRFLRSVESDSSFVITGVVINNSSTPLTRDNMFALLKEDGFVMLATSGMCSLEAGQTLTNHVISIRQGSADNNFYLDYFTSTGGIATQTCYISNTVFNDLGVNKIN